MVSAVSRARIRTGARATGIIVLRPSFCGLVQNYRPSWKRASDRRRQMDAVGGKTRPCVRLPARLANIQHQFVEETFNGAAGAVGGGATQGSIFRLAQGEYE